MSWRVLQAGNNLPYSWQCDPTASFQAGQIAQLTVIGNQVMATVSNGLAPIGVIDDQKTRAFTANAWDETIIVPAVGVPGPNNTLITPIDIKAELKNPNVIPSTFVSIPVDVQLIPRNGVIVFPAGTVLNFDLTGSGTFNAIKTNVRYTYQIPNIVGDDTTIGSKRITVWFARMMMETNMYEPNQVYPVNANLFCSEIGLFTTRQPTQNHPSIGLVTSPPSPMINSLGLLWL